MIYDMTNGSPLKMILSFSVPMLIGNIFQQIYNFVDAAVVGKFVGAESLAAVGATSTMMTLAICFMMGMTNGAGIIISQCFGKRSFGELKKTVTSLIYIVIILSVLTSAAGIILARPVLRILNTPERIIDESVKYIRIIFTFMTGTAAYNASGAALRSLGDSRTPLYALIISALLNVALDLLFVVFFKMGVAGAAAATVIAQIISAVFCISHIIRYRKQLNLDGLPRRADKRTVIKIFRTGLPAALESCLIALGTMSVQRLVNSFGPMTIAAYTASTRIDSIAIMPVISIGMSLSVFAGQNMGAGNIDRIKKGLYHTLFALIGICATLAAVIVIFRTRLLGMFLDINVAARAIEVGGRYLTIVCTAYIVAAIMRTYLNVLRGAGDVNTSAVSGITELIARIIFAYILVRPFGSTGIWMATPLAWAAGAVVPVVRYYSGKWKEKRLV
ncbi:MAG: MATE family efflux transporter [Oscillospiraceae bacterium]|nr:MATE family efflux transporter [Oscillospiraceae bacterium]